MFQYTLLRKFANNDNNNNTIIPGNSIFDKYNNCLNNSCNKLIRSVTGNLIFVEGPMAHLETWLVVYGDSYFASIIKNAPQRHVTIWYMRCLIGVLS